MSAENGAGFEAVRPGLLLTANRTVFPWMGDNSINLSLVRVYFEGGSCFIGSGVRTHAVFQEVVESLDPNTSNMVNNSFYHSVQEFCANGFLRRDIATLSGQNLPKVRAIGIGDGRIENADVLSFFAQIKVPNDLTAFIRLTACRQGERKHVEHLMRTFGYEIPWRR